MSNLLFQQIWTLYVFPNKALKWQIWKCELGWFSLGGSHIYLCERRLHYTFNLLKNLPSIYYISYEKKERNGAGPS